MTVNELASALSLEVINLSDPERSVEGVYTGDLLSWVMGKLKYGYAWVTIMNNVNVIAVASLVDASCVILSEDAEVGDDLIEKAGAQKINLLRTSLSSFEICCKLGKTLNA